MRLLYATNNTAHVFTMSSLNYWLLDYLFKGGCMQKSWSLALFISFLFVCGADQCIADELERESYIVKQENCPIEISDYKMEYYERRKGIWHTTQFINITDKEILAIEFRFVLIDVFDEFLSHHSHVKIEKIIPQTEKKKRDAETPYKSNSFHSRRNIDVQHALKSYVYIYKVRFLNGEIWECDWDSIVKQVLPKDDSKKLQEPDMLNAIPLDDKA